MSSPPTNTPSPLQIEDLDILAILDSGIVPSAEFISQTYNVSPAFAEEIYEALSREWTPEERAGLTNAEFIKKFVLPNLGKRREGNNNQ